MNFEGKEQININESQQILKKFDKESSYRSFHGYRGKIISIILVCFSLFQLFSTWYVIPSTHMRPIHLAIVVSLSFILYPFSKKTDKKRLPWYDIILAIVALIVFLYPAIAFKNMINQFGYTRCQITIGAIAILLLFEACRRVVGIQVVIIASCFVLLGLFGMYLPGVLGNRGFTVRQLVQHLYYTQEGVFGTPLGASSTFIFLFILFGSFLEKTGVGEFFIDFANSICGHRRGGPAKVAVISSALMGTVSGSSVANTVASGSFTIPMMKKLGYTSEFAGAVEAAASTGGQIMPPVMGAAAFLMAENLGLPFGDIIKAAVIPAALYFAGIYIVTDLEARKLGLVGIPKSECPKTGKIMIERGFLILPIIVIIVLLAVGYTASFSALIGLLTTIVGSYFPSFLNYIHKTTAEQYEFASGLKYHDYFEALENGARSIISVSLACGTAGVIVGMITKTGIGLKIGSKLTLFADGHLVLLMFFTMIASIILGMGVPTTPNYLITSTIMAPIIYKSLVVYLPETYNALLEIGEGYALLPAHLFAFYFGIIADITPPVALAAMAGAAIAKGNTLKTGINASKLAIAAFLIPYIFVFNPRMLMLNATWFEIIQIVFSSLIGMIGIGMCMEKYCMSGLNYIQQLLSLIGGVLLVYPGLLTDVIGIILVGTVFLWQRIEK